MFLGGTINPELEIHFETGALRPFKVPVQCIVLLPCTAAVVERYHDDIMTS